MPKEMKMDDMLPSTILAALAKLDPKGTDEKISQSMAIVFEAFRLQATEHSLSAEDLYAAAIHR